MEDLTTLSGRTLVVNQKDSSIFPDEIKIPAIKDGQCQRCGSRADGKLPSHKKYCRECVGLGRISESEVLVRVPGQGHYPKLFKGGLTWKGNLTANQAKISNQLVRNFQMKKNSLVHAVTGAGKTEMLFKVIAECLKNGRRACIATPRIDVVNELYPRFEEAFARVKIGKYHGREFREIQNEQLTICTTHQLMKFFQAFDLLVIDEVDSFPYANSAPLHFAAKNAVKSAGVRIYLTATPTDDLLTEVKTAKLELLKLKRRYHGGLLPVPKEKLFLRSYLLKKKLNPNLSREIIQTIRAGHPLLLFVPRIEEIPFYLQALKKVKGLEQVKMAGVHASDPERLAKVAAFRQRKLDLLVTTTILERGVTFKNVWVIILAADDPIYSSASLVQIAGRVGRAKDDPNGLVLFCYHKYTKAIAAAIQQIKEMNRE